MRSSLTQPLQIVSSPAEVVSDESVGRPLPTKNRHPPDGSTNAALARAIHLGMRLIGCSSSHSCAPGCFNKPLGINYLAAFVLMGGATNLMR